MPSKRFLRTQNWCGLKPTTKTLLPPSMAFAEVSAARQKGPREKGAPRNHPETSSQKLADFGCRFPYDCYGRDRGTILALFRRRILGQYPAAPCSPGPFCLLLKVLPVVQMALQTDNNYFQINYAAIHSRYTEIQTKLILEIIFI